MSTSRRSALKRGLAAVGGLVGVGVGDRIVGAAPAGAAESGGPQQLTLYGRDWHSYSPVRPAGVLPSRGDRLLASGDLHLAPDGEKIGEFHAAAFTLAPPGQVGPSGAGSLELHTLQLDDGSIVAAGVASPDTDLEDVFAIIGGPGRYAGARGTYVARQRPREFGGDGTAVLTLTFVAEEI